MTTALDANAFISRGHYYLLEDDAASSTCLIVDKNNNELSPNAEDDDTYLGIEPYTGLSVIIKERYMYNMLLFNDELFDMKENDNGLGKFLPLVYIKREGEWTNDQMDWRFSDILMWIRLRKAFMGIFLSIALICLLIVTYLTVRYC